MRTLRRRYDLRPESQTLPAPGARRESHLTMRWAADWGVAGTPIDRIDNVGVKRWPERLMVTLMIGLAIALYIAMWNPDWSAMDASDAVALVAVIASGIVGLAAVISSVFVAKADRTHAAQMAIQDRRQARLESAYVELLTFAAAVGAWAQALLPAVDGDPADPARDAPPLPDRADEWSMTAKVAAFGSTEVQGALEAWRMALHEVQHQVRKVQLRGARDSGDWFEPWAELDDTAKPAEVDARRRLQVLVAVEFNELKDRP